MKPSSGSKNRSSKPLQQESQLVQAMKQITLHDHLCLIYKNKKEQFSAIIPFMRMGLERGEKCVYIADENSAQEIFTAMKEGGIAVDKYRKSGALSIITKTESYLKKGYFDPDEMIAYLKVSTDLAKKQGYKGLRATGEMTWILGGEPGTDRLIEYETKLNAFFPHQDCLAICQYNETRFSPDVLLDVIRTHPLAVVGERVCKNFYYVPAKTFFPSKGNRYHEVDQLLHTLEDRNRIEKQLEEQQRTLQTSQQLLIEAQRIGHFGHFDWDARTDTIIWSDEYYRIYGIDPKTKPPGYQKHLKAYTAESAKILDLVVKNAMATGKPYAVDLECLQKNAPSKWVTARGEVKRDAQNNIIGLRGTSQDITERKGNENELHRTNRALRLLSNANQAMMHHTEEMALLKEIGTLIIESAGYLFTWFGSVEQDANKTIRPVTFEGAETNYLKKIQITWADTPRGRGPTGTAARTGKIVISHDIQTDPKMLPWRKEAIKRGYQSSIALPLSSSNTVFGVLTIYADHVNAFNQEEISILEELAYDLAFGITAIRQRVRIEERTEEVNMLKNKFIQIVSHQLRTPLNIIRWNVESLIERERGNLTPSQLEPLRSVYVANLEIISRLNDLLTAIDIEEGHVRLELAPTDLGDLFQSVCEEKIQPCELKNLTCTLPKKHLHLPTIHVDPVKIRDMVARLIDNAITYTPDHGTISIHYGKKGNKIRFEITDTGVGIPASEQQHIFERFHRGWNASQMKTDASGLSLYIAKHTIEAHHGTIGFTSQEKKGSTFWFELPVDTQIL